MFTLWLIVWSSMHCMSALHGASFTPSCVSLQSTATFWSLPLRCNAAGMGVGPTEGFCAECGCGGGKV